MSDRERSQAEDVRLLANRDHARLLEKYRPVVHGLATIQLRADLRHQADDIAQNVLLRLWRELEAGKRYCDRDGRVVPFGAVVRLVTSWLVKDFLQKRDRAEPVPGLDDEPGADGIDELVARLDLAAAIDQLPGRAAAVCRLALLEDVPAPEIARRLGITVNNVYQRLHQGTKALVEILEAYA